MPSILDKSNSYLRTVTSKDLELIFTWRNKPEIRRNMFNSALIEWKTHLEWFNSLKNGTENNIKMFIENNEPRGIIQVNKINRYHQTAEWGFYIGDSYREGLGTLLACHALNYIFDKLDIRKLNAQVLSINEKSLRFHKKVGFTQEGVLYEQIVRDDSLINVHLFAQFKENWEKSKQVMGDYIHE